MSGAIELLASKVAVGHCVIAGEIAIPQTQAIGVVVRVDCAPVSIGGVVARADPVAVYIMGLDDFWASGTLPFLPKLITPANDFGVRVLYGDGRYWCEPDDNLECTATYRRDGTHRLWQPLSGQLIVEARKDAITVALEAVAKTKEDKS